MDKDQIIDIINILSSTIPSYENDCAHFPEKGYECFPISKENFHSFKSAVSERKIAFIDGGNAEILKAPNFSLHFIRVFASVYQGRNKLAMKKYEFYALIHSAAEGNEIVYKTNLFPVKESVLLDENELSFSSFDQTLRSGMHRAEISRVGDAIRRFAELRIAAEITKNLDANDLIILDGTLQATLTNEEKHLEELYQKAAAKNIVVSALAKTSSIFTKKGNSMSGILNEIGQNEKWFYYPVANISNDSHKVKLFFVKLHEKSNYVFRFEVYNRSEFKPDELFSNISIVSKDPVFLGYPYGLIEADRFARVSNEEKESLKIQFMVKSGKTWNKLIKYVNSVNAHDVLDSI